jgi:hypothetical protein
MRVYFDTAVLVAGTIEDHPHYGQSDAALESVREKKSKVLSAVTG